MNCILLQSAVKKFKCYLKQRVQTGIQWARKKVFVGLYVSQKVDTNILK